MDYYSLHGFSFETESFLLSAQDELDLSQREYEQWQRLLELDIEAFTPLPSPNDRYEAYPMAAQRISIQNDHTQDFHHQHARRRNDAHEYLHPSQFTDWVSNSDTRVESSAVVLRDEPQYSSDLPDEPMRQIIHSGSYPDRLAPGLNIYGHTIPLENEARVPPISIANMPEDGNYAFRVMAGSEEEYPRDEDVIFYAVSEEESSDDERGFEGDDEDSDGHMNLGRGEEGGELTEEYDEAMHMVEEVSFTRISRRSIFDRNYAETIVEEGFWEIKWPSGAWHSAFNRTEYN